MLQLLWIYNQGGGTLVFELGNNLSDKRINSFTSRVKSSELKKFNIVIVIGIHISHRIKITSCLVTIKSFGGKSGMTSAEHRPGRWYLEAMCCPDYIAPVVLTRFKGIQAITFEASLVVVVARSLSVLTAN